METYFTSDTHYGHRLMAKMRVGDDSPKSIQEMDEWMIAAWNARVRPGDRVYHLGDLSFRDLKQTQNITRRLNGQIHLVLGNHDHKRIKRGDSLPNVCWTGDYLEVKVDSKLLECGKLVLCHYAFEVWNKSHYGSIHLHGHSHGSLPSKGKRMDVGVDTRPDRAPWSLDEVLAVMDKRQIHGPDHHRDPKARETDD